MYLRYAPRITPRVDLVHASPWRRHRALRVLALAWPELAAASPPSRATLGALVAGAVGSSLRLVAPAEAPAGYEPAVSEGAVPTREGSWHDTFNVLAFIAFPRAKLALHRRVLALQRARAAAGAPAGVRSREEDALALLDEGTLVIAGPPEAIAALDEARREGSLARIDEVMRTHGLVVRVLGHALLEHLVLERTPIGAGVLTLALPEPPTLAAIDRALAERISTGGFPVPCTSPTLPWPDPTVDGWIGLVEGAPGAPTPPATGEFTSEPRLGNLHPPAGVSEG
jgi:hypothetical protein